jgi:O-antigen/teichoic acid export membrane protein
MALKQNLVANVLGQGWASLMGLVFVPVYIKYLGMESYGLIGLFAILQTWLSLLDMGMSPTLNREMARFTAGTHDTHSIRDLLRSIEIIAIGVGCIIALGVWGISNWLATDWLKAEKLPIETVARAFTVMGVVTGLRFVEGIYRSSILGLQRQVLFNTINSIFATVRGLGAIAVLAMVSPTIEAFFIWQGFISVVMVLALATTTYRAIPNDKYIGHFSVTALHKIGRYAVGMLGITLLSLCLTQVDKVILSKSLSLTDYGYYSLGIAVSSVISMLGVPISQTYFPRLSELLARDDQKELIAVYHHGAQVVAAIIGSMAVVLILFSESILFLWTKNAELAHHNALLVSVLIFGNLLNAFMWMPYQAQLSHGWTSLSFRINIVSVIVIVPAFFLVIPRFGALGAAWVWVGLNLGYVLVGVQFMYRKILKDERRSWYQDDVLKPIIAATVVAFIVRLLASPTKNLITQALVLVLVSLLTLCAALFASTILRKELGIVFKRIASMLVK